jgi:hypothetical protein
VRVQEFIAALELPSGCRVDQRVPKKMLVENGAPTAADKRMLNDAIEEFQWLAALKPNTIGVPEFRDEIREYLEIAVLCVTLRGVADDQASKPANVVRLSELVHRAVPYPVVLVLDAPQGLSVSMAHKRWAQNVADKVVLDGEMVSVTLADDLDILPPFCQAVALRGQSQASLMALYQSWIECLQALQAARHTGIFKAADTPEDAQARRLALQVCERLGLEAARLRTQAAKEKQLQRQVELNLALKRIQAELSAARGHL